MKKRFDRLSLKKRYGLIAGFLVTILATAHGQENTFSSGSNGSDGALFVIGSLAPADDISVVYDSARNELVAFGGQLFSPTVEIDHTYTFDGVSWNRKRPGVSPPARDGAAMAYDATFDKTIIYGGSYKNDCWLWDGSEWTELAPPDLTTYFEQFGMVHDKARGETLLIARPLFSSTELETWAFNGSTWIKKAPATPVNSGNQFAILYDEALQKVIMVVRVSSSDFQTWTWDGTDWSQVITDAVDLDDYSGKLVYDGRTNATLYLGYQASYSFSGTNWIPLENVPEVFQSGIDQVIYHPGLNALLRINGYFTSQKRNETWAWYADGSTEKLTAGSFTFDMAENPDGIWNFTTIDIGPNVTVDFLNNENNTPVRWLASDNVTIEGTLSLSAKRSSYPDLYPYTIGLSGIPGPGGYEGATAGPMGLNLRVPGGGPGGGLFTGGNNKSESGKFTTYSNPWIFPLTGGSGAGGGGDFSSGGAAGGALLIASNGEISIQGQILSAGNNQNYSSLFGFGSAGAVLLRANTIRGTGSISAGRIRLEAWERELDELTLTPLDTSYNQGFTQGPPLLPVELGQNPPKLWVESINGVPVANPRMSSKSQLEVDAYISGNGLLPIVIKGENIPNMAEIYLKISLQDQTILEPESVLFSGGQATFNVDLPGGFGAIAVTAKFPSNL